MKKRKRDKSVRDSRSIWDSSKKIEEKGIDIHLNFHLNPSLKSSKTIENLNILSSKQVKDKKHKYKRRTS